MSAIVGSIEQHQPPDAHGNLFLIAARAPVPGQTKTRLGTAIGMDRAARLYRAFLLDLATRFTPTAVDAPCSTTEPSPRVPGPRNVATYDLGWAFTPAEHNFRRVLHDLGAPAQPAGVRFVPQRGDGWGERQANVLRWGFDHGYDRVVLVASDSPHLPAATPAAAFTALDDHDVALGRVHDGGYYLIGLGPAARATPHALLCPVPMSTASSADALVARAATLGLSLSELPPTFDVDEVPDLDRLHAALAPGGAAAPATWAALHELRLERPTTDPCVDGSSYPVST